jgi:hypothetical protein
LKKNDILFIFHSPHSAWGLRHRASKLPEGNDYRLFLEALAKALGKKVISTKESRNIIEHWRAGNPELAVSILEKMLKERC